MFKKDPKVATNFAIMTSRHAARMSDPAYYRSWYLKNAVAQNLRSQMRPPITLPRVAFLERPEIYPELKGK